MNSKPVRSDYSDISDYLTELYNYEQRKTENPLPCPFCGFKPDLDDPDFVYPSNRERTLWQAGCIDNAGGCGAMVLGDTMEEAIKSWNTRVKL